MIDLKVMRTCAQACVNSYEGQYGEEREVLSDVVPFSKGHVEGHFGYKDRKLYIVFRGSDGLADWIDNFKFWQKSTKMIRPYGNEESKIKVHAGFIGQYKEVRKLIHRMVKSSGVKEVICTGHSLGGALATLCAVDIQYNFHVIVASITFGSPRMGNRYFVRSFNKRIDLSFRHVYKEDIVCKVPMPIFGYRHVATKIQLGGRRWWTFFGWHGDHYPERYRDALS